MASQQYGRDAGVCKKKVAEARSPTLRVGSIQRNRPDSEGQATGKPGKITGHWGEDAVGFRWTEQDSVDDRLKQMDVGRFYSATIWTPKEMTLKGIAVRIGQKSEASILFDTELLRVVCGWTGEFLEFNPARYGIISPPKVGQDIAFHSPRQPGWASDGKFADPRPKPFGPLPREWAKYRGLHLHGDRVVFEYTVGPKQVMVLESPWLETIDGEKVFTRELEIAPSDSAMELLVAESGTPVKLVCDENVATLELHEDKAPITVKVPPHAQAVRLMLYFPASAKSASQKLDERTRKPRISRKDTEKTSLQQLVEPGPARWTHEITTRGSVSDKTDALVVDTLTLPFDNPYKALMFVGGHDFLSGTALAAGGTGRKPNAGPATRAVPRSQTFDAAICTLHGDVWLVSGIDDKLERLTWKRFATGLFQPLGLKIVNDQIYVVGRDQITRLHDFNGDGEADWYENFNNDGQVSANGHEYVTCLETDSDGWFYFLKGNCDGKHDHDGCLLRVSPEGAKLEVVATGFRNANGLGIGPPGLDGREILTVAPQEGEWTPGSAIFEVQRGGFHGYTPSAHLEPVPVDFVKPLCWIPRLQDNSCGGQVWVPPNRWGPLGSQMLHLSYGTSRMFLVPRETVQRDEHGAITQGATIPLPLAFESGVMRGRFHPRDGHLYVSGLRGWVSNAEKDGCLQRVRHTRQPLDSPIGFKTYANGILLSFSDRLDPASAADPDNYRIEQWGYRWSAAYGSSDFKVSNPSQEGRDMLDVVSATLHSRPEGDAVFLELLDFVPSHQLSIQMTLKFQDGRTVDRRVDATIKVIPDEMHAVPSRPENVRRRLLVEEDLLRGVQLEFPQQPRLESRRLRMAAWRFEPGELTVDPRQPLTLVATGELQVPQRDRYRFAVEATSANEITLDGQVVWRSAERVTDQPAVIELRRGIHSFRIEQHVEPSQFEKPVALRWLWGSSSFEMEPIPPTSLFCEGLADDVTALQRGRELFVRHQCVRCHRVSDDVLASRAAMPELNAEAPDLIDAGARLRTDWLYHWVLNPYSVRNNTPMPRLFPLAPNDEHRQQAADLVAYLKSLGSPRPDNRLPTFDRSGPELDRGTALWEQLGCIGCHRMNKTVADDLTNRTSLHYVSEKFMAGELPHFLRDPQRHFPWNRMPNFQLMEFEAEALTVFLEQNTQGHLKNKNEQVAQPPGNATRGRELFATLGCRQCHRVSRQQPLPKPHLSSVIGKAVESGCLTKQDFESSAQRPAHIPEYGFRPVERAALLAFLRGDEHSLATETPETASRRLVNDLRCWVCHPRDGDSATLAEIYADESESGLPPENVPNLTWAGEKLHATWMQSFLAGQTAERPRPWMKLRMPSFPAPARLLAEGLAREHGLSRDPMSRPSAHPDLSEIGEVLATRTGLLDCRQCHPIGPLPPTGDKNTLLAPGINFALTRERLRHDFYRRFTLDPPRYDVTTRMPKLVVDGKTTKVKDILDGDARRQFEAVWHFLQSVSSTTADP